METIELEVNKNTARKIGQLTDMERQDLVRLIDIWLQDKRTLREVMNDISEYAQQQGMTSEILDDILNEK